MKVTFTPKVLLGAAFLSGIISTSKASCYTEDFNKNNDNNTFVYASNIETKNDNKTKNKVYDAKANISIATGNVIKKSSKYSTDSISNLHYNEQDPYEFFNEETDGDWVYDVDETGFLVKLYPNGIVKKLDE